MIFVLNSRVAPLSLLLLNLISDGCCFCRYDNDGDAQRNNETKRSPCHAKGPPSAYGIHSARQTILLFGTGHLAGLLPLGAR